MELSSLNIKIIYIFSQMKAFLIFFQKKSFVVFLEMEPSTSHPNPPKKQKKSTQKKFLIFPEMKLSSSNIKKIPYIYSKESVSYISRNGTLHFSGQAPKIKNNSSGEKFLHFRKRKSRKKFLYFRKWNFWVQSLNFF